MKTTKHYSEATRQELIAYAFENNLDFNTDMPTRKIRGIVANFVIDKNIAKALKEIRENK